MREHFAVDFDKRGDVSGPVETGGLGESVGAAGLEGIVFETTAVEEFESGLGPSGDVGDGSINDRRAADFAQDGEIAGEDRRAGGKGLDDGKAEAFGVAGEEDQIGAAIDRGELVRLKAAENDDRIGDPQDAGSTDQVVLERIADLDQPRFGKRAADTGEGFEQDVDPLSRDVRADVQYLRGVNPFRTGKSRRLGIGGRHGFGRKRRIDTKINDAKAVVGDQIERANRATGGLAVAGDERGFLESVRGFVASWRETRRAETRDRVRARNGRCRDRGK